MFKEKIKWANSLCRIYLLKVMYFIIEVLCVTIPILLIVGNLILANAIHQAYLFLILIWPIPITYTIAIFKWSKEKDEDITI